MALDTKESLHRQLFFYYLKFLHPQTHKEVQDSLSCLNVRDAITLLMIFVDYLLKRKIKEELLELAVSYNRWVFLFLKKVKRQKYF